MIQQYGDIMEIKKREKFLLIIITVIFGLVILYIVLYRPQHLRIADMKKEFNNIQMDINTAKFLSHDLGELEKEVLQIEKELAELQQRLPNRKHMPHVLKAFSDAAVSANINYILITVEEAESNLLNIVKQKIHYEKIPVQIDIISRYKNIADYVNNLGNLSRLVKIDSIEIKSEEELPLLKVTLHVSVYILSKM